MQGRAHCAADVEAAAVAAQMPRVAPGHVAAHLVGGVVAIASQQALGQAKGHRGIVGPFARPQVERPAADHIFNGGERAGQRELQGRADGVAGGQPQ